MTSRWGAPLDPGKIVLNTALAALPEELMDYVALHELVHFLHPKPRPGVLRRDGPADAGSKEKWAR